MSRSFEKGVNPVPKQIVQETILFKSTLEGGIKLQGLFSAFSSRKLLTSGLNIAQVSTMTAWLWLQQIAYFYLTNGDGLFMMGFPKYAERLHVFVCTVHSVWQNDVLITLITFLCAPPARTLQPSSHRCVLRVFWEAKSARFF